MSATKFTPGPWEWADVPRAGLQIRGPYQGSTRLMFSDIWRAFPEREWDATMIANARLATAAPELLAALQGFVNHGTCFDERDMTAARAAIAKAVQS